MKLKSYISKFLAALSLTVISISGANAGVQRQGPTIGRSSAEVPFG